MQSLNTLSFPELTIPIFRSLPPQVQTFLRKHGNEKITHLKIARKPISSIIRGGMNIISMGQLERNLREKGYDELFHLYLLVWDEWNQMKVYVLEKNQTIEIKEAHVNDISGENVQILDIGSISISWIDFFTDGEREAEKMGKNFFVYDARTDNCQVFVKEMMKGVNRWDQRIEDFVMQDPVAIFKNMGWLGRVAKTITNVAGRLSNSWGRLKNVFSSFKF